MDNSFTLRSGLALYTGIMSSDALSQFDIDGTEEEIFKRINIQLCFVFAKKYSELNGTNFEDEANKLKSKYINNKCECK